MLNKYLLDAYYGQDSMLDDLEMREIKWSIIQCQGVTGSRNGSWIHTHKNTFEGRIWVWSLLESDGEPAQWGKGSQRGHLRCALKNGTAETRVRLHPARQGLGEGLEPAGCVNVQKAGSCSEQWDYPRAFQGLQTSYHTGQGSSVPDLPDFQMFCKALNAGGRGAL